MEPESTPPQSSLLTRQNISVGVVLFAVLVSGLAYYFYAQAAKPKDAQKVALEEAQKLVAAVSKLMVLPDGELPIVATVADPSKLSDQPFFAKAKKGDKVLIYNSARKAILYDPQSNKIIDVAPLSIGSKASPTPTGSPTR